MNTDPLQESQLFTSNISKHPVIATVSKNERFQFLNKLLAVPGPQILHTHPSRWVSNHSVRRCCTLWHYVFPNKVAMSCHWIVHTEMLSNLNFTYGIGCFVYGSECIFGLNTMQENLLCYAKSSIGNILPRTNPLLIHTERAHILIYKSTFSKFSYPALTAPVPWINIKHRSVFCSKSLLIKMLHFGAPTDYVGSQSSTML
jgi:hypothetical protein